MVSLLNQPRLAYIVCTSPRSGSWLLCEGLQATKVAGKPREWFHKVAEKDRSAQWGIAPPAEHGYADYLARVLQTATTPNGVFGLKLHWYQLAQLPKKLDTIDGFQDIPIQDSFRRLLPNLKLIWLTRRNKIRQAISLYRARQTGSWWHPDSYAVKRPVLGEAVFDPMAIDAAERHLLSNEGEWQKLFREWNVKPHVIVYEDLVENYEDTLRQVLGYLEISEVGQIPIVPPKMKSQSDATTEEWLQRYIDFKQRHAVKTSGTATSGSATSGSATSGSATSGSATSGSATSGSALSARRQGGELSARWRRVLAGMILQGIKDPDVVEVLVRGGVSRPVAEVEVARSHTHPYLRAAEGLVKRLKNSDDVLSVYGGLEKLRPLHRQIIRRAKLSSTDFLHRFYAANRPVILTGFTKDWPASSRWSSDYLTSLLATERIDIQLRDPNASGDGRPVSQKTVSFAQMLDQMSANPARNSCFLGNPEFLRRPSVQALWDDVAPWPDYLKFEDRFQGTSLAIEPAGYASPLRHEFVNILLVQVCGQKQLKLVPAFDRGFLYCGRGRVSKVNPHQPDFVKYPKYEQASVIDVTLKTGEALFLPVGWWHCEQTLDLNIALILTNFKFPNRYSWSSNSPQKDLERTV